MQKVAAEFIGTFTLVFIGCGAAVMGGAALGPVGIALAFGFAIVAMAYCVGSISGCHINPAVSIGMWVAKRITALDAAKHIVAQCLGALAGAFFLMTLMKGHIAGYDVAASGLGQNGWGEGYMGGYTLHAAFLFELVATFLFVTVILGATKDGSPFAGLVIGLTLSALILAGLNITGVSLNPARSFGPAMLVGGQAMEQLWLFWAAPLIGGALAGLTSRCLHCDTCCGSGHCH